MTTQASPDGQQQAATAGDTAATTITTTTVAPGDAEAIRNWGDVRKVIVSRDEFKASTQQLETTMAAIVAKLDAIGKAPVAAGDQQAAAGDAAPAASALEAQVKQLADAMKGIVDERSDAAKVAKRKAITDAIVGQANEQSRDLVRGAVAMMALDGELDLYGPDAGVQVESALTKLRANNPGYFAGAPNLLPAAGEKDFRLPAGVELHDLTDEQIARLSQEDFNKLHLAPRTSRLAF